MKRRVGLPGFAGHELLDFLGESNHGLYYRANDPEGGGDLTLKILVDPASDEQFECLANEVRVLATHPSDWLVRIVRAGHHRGRLYYGYRYLPMGTLARPIRALSRTEILRAVEHGARGLHQLHGLGIVHRDFKPRKVLLHEDGALLNDLGIADFEAHRPSDDLAPTGSIGFMAPEVAAGDRATPHSDVFSIGATLHVALTGQPIHPAVPRHDLLAAIRHVAHTEPTIAPGLPAELDALIRRCLAARAQDRPADAQTVAHALAAVRLALTPDLTGPSTEGTASSPSFQERAS